MPDVPVDRLRSILQDKLGFVNQGGAKHDKYELYVDGVYVAHTTISRNNEPIRDRLFGMMARQVGVTSPQLRQIVGCTIDRDGYLSIVNS